MISLNRKPTCQFQGGPNCGGGTCWGRCLDLRCLSLSDWVPTTYFDKHQRTSKYFFFSTVTVYFVRSIFWFLGAGSSIDFSSPLILSPLQSTKDLFVDTKSGYSNFSMACFAVGWVAYCTKTFIITIIKAISSSYNNCHYLDFSGAGCAAGFLSAQMIARTFLTFAPHADN